MVLDSVILTTKPGKTGSYLQKSKVLIYYQVAKPDEFFYYKILVMNVKKNALFQCKKIKRK